MGPLRFRTQITLLERGSGYLAALDTAKIVMLGKSNWKKDDGPAEIRTQDLTVISRALHRAKLRARLYFSLLNECYSSDTPNTHTGTLIFRSEAF